MRSTLRYVKKWRMKQIDTKFKIKTSTVQKKLLVRLKKIVEFRERIYWRIFDDIECIKSILLFIYDIKILFVLHYVTNHIFSPLIKTPKT